jgi:hypothetical protein
VRDKALVATLQSGMDFSQLEELDPSLSEVDPFTLNLSP